MKTFKLVQSELKIKRLKKKIKRLERDIDDMNGSHQTRFDRCDRCGRLNDYNYQCQFCLEKGANMCSDFLNTLKRS